MLFRSFQGLKLQSKLFYTSDPRLETLHLRFLKPYIQQYLPHIQNFIFTVLDFYIFDIEIKVYYACFQMLHTEVVFLDLKIYHSIQQS